MDIFRTSSGLSSSEIHLFYRAYTGTVQNLEQHYHLYKVCMRSDLFGLADILVSMGRIFFDQALTDMSQEDIQCMVAVRSSRIDRADMEPVVLDIDCYQQETD